MASLLFEDSDLSSVIFIMRPQATVTLLFLATIFCPSSRAQVPNDIGACGTSAGAISTCLLANLGFCDDCQTLTPVLDPEAPACGDICNELDVCCEACRDVALEYANVCGACDDTIECSFGPSTPTTEAPRDPCEQATQAYVRCPFQPENLDLCGGVNALNDCVPFEAAGATGILQEPYKCQDFQQALCIDSATDGCCDPCKGSYQVYVNACFFEDVFQDGSCSCQMDSPSTSGPMTPLSPTPDETAPPPSPPTTPKPTIPDETAPTRNDPLTIAPTDPLDDFCESESVALDNCAEAECRQCDEELEDSTITSFGVPTCDSIQMTCGAVQECCPQCFGEYNAVMECLFLELLGTSCSCSGSKSSTRTMERRWSLVLCVMATLGIGMM